ncbi:hypothetical protein NKI79_17885 [Mesorhizobium sp. M0340]|uniref:hypothetical protein n=1 Tax=Mesorhizobium sp. M0340 TaxID=2956939 RepID=UPI00333B46F9
MPLAPIERTSFAAAASMLHCSTPAAEIGRPRQRVKIVKDGQFGLVPAVFCALLVAPHVPVSNVSTFCVALHNGGPILGAGGASDWKCAVNDAAMLTDWQFRRPAGVRR